MSSKNLYVLIDDMTWCVPGDRLDQLERMMRFTPESSTGSVASIIVCYRELVTCPRAKREHIVRNLKRIMKEREDKP